VTGIRDLPQDLPIFPLNGVLLLPGGKLPLNIFEPRYLAMADAALAGDRMIGMIQPNRADAGPVGGVMGGTPELYETGCAGRIVSFSETEDGRYLIELRGVCRFRVAEELEACSRSGYRRVRPDFAPFAGDLAPPPLPEDVDRAGMLEAMRGYFKCQGMKANWEVIEATPSRELITSLAMICPFPPGEKQALLECEDCAERAEMLTALMRMATLDPDAGEAGGPRH
jgi:hypothetical protein